MPQYVVDASVAAKWYFEEEHSAEAARLLAEDEFDLVPTVDLVASALHTALQVRRSVYDSVYLTYAVQAGALLLTGDRKFYDAIKAGELARPIAWIGDLAP